MVRPAKALATLVGTVHFKIAHELDLPVDALERALASPRLAERFDAAVQKLRVGVEKITEHRRILAGGVLDRVRHYQASVTLPAFAISYLTGEHCVWDVESVYTMATHAGRWKVVTNVKPEWRDHIASSGTYTVEALEGGRSRRTVEGDVDIRVPLVSWMVEKLVLAAVNKTLAAEAAMLREMSV
jgi:Protein of unknown function (DUF2505)